VSHNAKLLEASRVNGTTAKLMEAEQAETTRSLSQFRSSFAYSFERQMKWSTGPLRMIKAVQRSAYRAKSLFNDLHW